MTWWGDPGFVLESQEVRLMRPILRLLFGVIVALCLITGAPADPLSAQDPLPHLEGWVRSDGVSGELSGAIVEIRQGERIRRVKAGPDGRYRVVGLRPGRAELSVFHLAAHPFDASVDLPALVVVTGPMITGSVRMPLARSASSLSMCLPMSTAVTSSA